MILLTLTPVSDGTFPLRIRLNKKCKDVLFLEGDDQHRILSFEDVIPSDALMGLSYWFSFKKDENDRVHKPKLHGLLEAKEEGVKINLGECTIHSVSGTNVGVEDRVLAKCQIKYKGGA